MVANEIESKFELDREDFKMLMSNSSIREYHDLLNIYYDYEAQLVGESATFRVRYSHCSEPMMTLKIPLKIQKERREVLEVDYPCKTRSNAAPAKTYDVEHDLPVEFQEHFHRFGIKKLKRMGWMRAQRWEVQLPDGSEIELDQVELPNGDTFFEAEIENHDDEKQQEAIEMINQLTSSARPSLYSKFERFCMAISDMPSKKL